MQITLTARKKQLIPRQPEKSEYILTWLFSE
jgi:hypothetical protein